MAAPKIIIPDLDTPLPDNAYTTNQAEIKAVKGLADKLSLLQRLCLVVLVGHGVGISLVIGASFLAKNTVLSVFAFCGLLIALCYGASYWLARVGSYRWSCWLLIGTGVIYINVGYWLLGTHTIMPIVLLGMIALSIVLMNTWEAVLVMIVCLVSSTSLYVLEDLFTIYTPPVIISDQVEALINLAIVVVIIPIILIILVIPARTQTHALQAQNNRLERVLIEHYQALGLLQDSEEQLRATFEQAAVGIARIGMNGRWQQVNQRFCDIVGYSQEELLDLTYYDLTNPDDHPQTVPEVLPLLSDQPRSFSKEKRYIRKDGRSVWVSLSLSLVEDSSGEPKYIVSVVQDIDERKRAEQQVLFQASLLGQVRNAIIVTDTAGKITYWNKFAETLYQWKAEEVLGRMASEVLSAETTNERYQETLLALRQGGHWEGEYTAKRKDGTTLLVHTVNTAIKDSKGNLQAFVGVSLDMTERKQAEEALAAETERLAVTLRSIGDGVITTDRDSRVVLINLVAEKLTGWTQAEAVGKLLPEIFQIVNNKTREPAQNPVEKVLQTGSIVGLASGTALLARDGTERFISNSAAPIDRGGQAIGVVLVFRDVTERMKMEEEIQKNQKLESLGILAGGIAHDFNNILTAIVGNIFMAKMESRVDDEIYELLTEAETATFRAKDLTQQLLTFSRGGAPIKRTASLKEMLKESVGFALRGSKVRSRFYIPDDLWTAEIDAGQINQVINNLVINADQAMPQGGQLTVSAENCPTGSYDPGLPLKSGDYLRVVFQDEGTGIPPQNLSKIFDPYFTTKQKGSGLGLATTFSIITRHDGYLSVTSEMGKGSTFTIYLPASPQKVASEEKVEEPMLRGSGKVLLMDDDKMIRDMGARVLRQLGYEVDVARDGEEALELYQEAMVKRGRYDVVIMDLTVPGGMGGKEAISNLLKIDPTVKAIVSSGYSNDPVMANYQAYHFQGVLTKPFLVDDLSHKIKKLIKDD